MSETINFVLHDKVGGAEITPSTIDFTRFNEFNQQVEDFVAGSNDGKKLLLDTVYPSVQPGSYRLSVMMSLAVLAAVEPQVRALSRQDALSSLDPKRAKIVAKWQSKAKTRDDLFYEVEVVRSDGRPAPIIRIGPETNFSYGALDPWVPIETYLLGEIYDMGGEKPNVHIRLVESGETHIVQTDKSTLRGLDKNLLYEKTLLRVAGEQNTNSRELRNLRLMEFVNYNHSFDEAALDRFSEAGREAWADVPDAAEWVRKLRGG